MIQSLIFAIHNLYYAFKWTNLVSFKGMIFNIQMKTFLSDRKSFLFILAVGNTIAFATWQVLLNNFVVSVKIVKYVNCNCIFFYACMQIRLSWEKFMTAKQCANVLACMTPCMHAKQCAIARIASRFYRHSAMRNRLRVFRLQG